MNHPCHKCGHTIEDGKPFCAECGAPQIRVMLPEAAVEPIIAAGGALLVGRAEAEPVLHGESANPLAVGWSHDLRPCALAAAVAIVLSFLGLNPFVAALGAGWLAIVFSRRRGLSALRPATGARLGAMSGLLLFGMSTIFETLAVVVLHKGAEVKGEMLDKIRQVSERYPGPQVQPFLDFVRTPEGFAFMMIGSVLFALVGFIVLAGLGGAVAAAVLGRHGRP
jgi:hypothetical protein